MSDTKTRYTNEFLGEFEIPRLIVIKIGSALLVDTKSGELKHDWIKNLAQQVKSLRDKGHQVVLVSSGAVGAGKGELGIGIGGNISLRDKQAAATSGNPVLMSAYGAAFAEHEIKIGQVLITPMCTKEPRRNLNLRDTLQSLLKMKAVPIINENDAITTTEIRYGDNDTLSALVAGVISANWLILLSDIDGLYDDDPRKNTNAKWQAEVTKLTDEIKGFGKDAGTAVSTGGMRTKLVAAQIAIEQYGCHMLIADGTKHNAITNLFERKARATWFKTSRKPKETRLDLISTHATANNGAALILKKGSLTPGQAKDVLPDDLYIAVGNIQRGDAVNIFIVGDPKQPFHFGCGLVEHSSKEIEMIKGLQSKEKIEATLKYNGRTSIIRKENMVVNLQSNI
ncbi:MAG: glutamate 5-kinase [Sneathiellales bacterium]|nr:glutamate 5-kinase [Sneathiellales bacterium]